MVNDFLVIRRDQSAATEAADLLAVVRDLRSVYERLGRIKAKMGHAFDDGGGENAIDWSAVETLWGVPPGNTSVDPTANGAKIYTFVNGAVGSMEGLFQVAAVKTLTESVG